MIPRARARLFRLQRHHRRARWHAVLFYEEGAAGGRASANNTASLVLAHFNLEWLTQGRDTLEAAPASPSKTP